MTIANHACNGAAVRSRLKTIRLAYAKATKKRWLSKKVYIVMHACGHTVLITKPLTVHARPTL